MAHPWPEHLASELMVTLDLAVIDLTVADAHRLIGDPPAWFSRFLPDFDASTARVDLKERFLYLESFLAEAQEHWDSGGEERLRSGIWSEPDNEGKHVSFEATAVLVAGVRLLLIAMIEAKFERRQDLIQKARVGKLDAMRQIWERQREADGWRDLADELEIVVSERTRELQLANRLLREEIADREEAESRVSALRGQMETASRTGTLGEIANQLAHELNQPLGAIQNYLRAGLRFMDGGEEKRARASEAVERSIVQAERAGAIVANLREFIATGHFERELTQVNDLVREVTRLLQPEFERAAVDCRLDLAAVPPRVYVNAIQIQQVLFNLVKNGIEALEEHPLGDRRLRIATMSDTGGGVEITVADSGPGLDSDRLARIFEPYYSTKVTGMGLGLAICRSIAEAHGGTLLADKEPGPGLTFHFRLPPAVETSA